MRLLPLAFLLIGISSSAIPARAAPSETPVEVLQQAVSLSDDLDVVEKFLSTGFRADIRHLTSLTNCNFWDANLFTGQQNQSYMKLVGMRIISATTQSAIISVTLAISVEGTPAPQKEETFFLIKEGAQWKIDEIIIDPKPDPRFSYVPFLGTVHAQLHNLSAHDCQRPRRPIQPHQSNRPAKATTPDVIGPNMLKLMIPSEDDDHHAN